MHSQGRHAKRARTAHQPRQAAGEGNGGTFAAMSRPSVLPLLFYAPHDT
jgi:hypothetical protein